MRHTPPCSQLSLETLNLLTEDQPAASPDPIHSAENVLADILPLACEVVCGNSEQWALNHRASLPAAPPLVPGAQRSCDVIFHLPGYDPLQWQRPRRRKPTCNAPCAHSANMRPHAAQPVQPEPRFSWATAIFCLVAFLQGEIYASAIPQRHNRPE